MEGEVGNLSWVFIQMDKRTIFPPPLCTFPEPGQGELSQNSPLALFHGALFNPAPSPSGQMDPVQDQCSQALCAHP